MENDLIITLFNTVIVAVVVQKTRMESIIFLTARNTLPSVEH